MIISRTPMRISLFGGGTDFPKWYKENGGAVINGSINKYTFINIRNLPPFFDFKYCIRYYNREETNNINSIKHPSVKACLNFLKVKKGIEIVHNADLPAMSGLGTSSSFTVGLLNAIYALQGKYVTKKELAYNAIEVEQNIIKEAVGSQDQVASAFGGLNKIEFNGEDITVNPLILNKNRLEQLETSLLLYFTGLQRDAKKIEADKIKNIFKKNIELEEMQILTNEAFKYLTSSRKNFDDLGLLLNEQWKLKKSLSSKVTNNKIDQIYKEAIKAGALGGKLLGAGAGGFILFYVNKNKLNNVKKKLDKLLNVPFRFDFTGSQIIYYSQS